LSSPSLKRQSFFLENHPASLYCFGNDRLLVVRMISSLFVLQLVMNSNVSKKWKFEEAKRMSMTYAAKFPSCPMISSEELFSLMKSEPPLIVDVRDIEECNVSMIPGAVAKKDFEDLLASPLTAPSKDKLIVVYCTIGYRSGVYATHLIQDCGYKQARNSEGVILWTHLPESRLECKNLDGSASPCDKVHTYGSAWDLADPRYQTVQYGVFLSSLSFIWQTLFNHFGGGSRR
jgi:rhodanese-related sulfurtransferase